MRVEFSLYLESVKQLLEIPSSCSQVGLIDIADGRFDGPRRSRPY